MMAKCRALTVARVVKGTDIEFIRAQSNNKRVPNVAGGMRYARNATESLGVFQLQFCSVCTLKKNKQCYYVRGAVLPTGSRVWR